MHKPINPLFISCHDMVRLYIHRKPFVSSRLLHRIITTFWDDLLWPFPSIQYAFYFAQYFSPVFFFLRFVSSLQKFKILQSVHENLVRFQSVSFTFLWSKFKCNIQWSDFDWIHLQNYAEIITLNSKSIKYCPTPLKIIQIFIFFNKSLSL